MQNKFFLPLLFCILFSQVSFTQNTKDEVDEDEYYEPLTFEKYSVGLSLSSLLNNFGGIQISQDIGLSPKFNIALETGYIFYRLDENSVNGFRIKPGFQYITYGGEYFSLSLGINYLYRRTVREELYERIFFEENFRELREIDRIRILSGAEFMISSYYRIGNRLRLEFAFGLGLAKLSIKSKPEIPTNFRPVDFESFWQRQIDNLFPVFTMNLNVSYDIFTCE